MYIFLSILLFVIILLIYLAILNDIQRSFLENNSIALDKLKEINKYYEFNDIKKYNFEHSYDNEKLFNEISCGDYLIYQLQLIKNDIIRDINRTNYNKALYNDYINEIKHINVFGNYKTDKKIIFKKKIKRLELKMFNNIIKKPIINFVSIVDLYRTDLNGRVFENKRQCFSENEIRNLIVRLNKRNGSFYLDFDIWTSISKVERGKVSNKLRFFIYDRDGNRCLCCGKKDDLEIDHIVPISKGGKTEANNLQTLCHRCNVNKGDKTIDYRRR